LIRRAAGRILAEFGKRCAEALALSGAEIRQGHFQPLTSPRQGVGAMLALIYFLLIGLAAGWLAGQIMKGQSFGLAGNLIVGIVGAILGGFLFRLVGLAAVGLLGSLIAATVGAIVLLFILQKIRK
jgi:uncharacterized membrane protein YeaQ/YmgE (transglycosylase-associated protein family)